MAKSNKSYKDLLMEDAEKNPYDKKDLSYIMESDKPIETAEAERKRTQSRQKWDRILEKVKGK
jgi:hypothetical protein